MSASLREGDEHVIMLFLVFGSLERETSEFNGCSFVHFLSSFLGLREKNVVQEARMLVARYS